MSVASNRGGSSGVSEEDKIAEIIALTGRLGESRQTISVTDLISEGPIYGLVDGMGGVYLDDDKQTDPKYGNTFYSHGPSNITLTNDSTTATVVLYGDQTLELQSGTSQIRYLCIRDYIGYTVTKMKSWGRNTAASRLEGPSSWIASGDVSGNTMSTYTPIRLIDPNGYVLIGRFHKVSGDYGYWQQSYFSGGVHHNTGNDYGHFKDHSSFTAYKDRVVEVSNVSAATYDAATGTNTYTVTLGSNWTHSYEKDFNAASGSVVVAGSDSIVISSHEFATGDAVRYQDGGGTTIPGLTDEAIYYIIKVDANTVKLATTAARAADGTAENITDVGSGTQTLEAAIFKFDDLGYDLSGTAGAHVQTAHALVRDPGTQIQFRVGNLVQPPLAGEGGIGSSAITNNIGTAIEATSDSDFGGTQAPIHLEGLSSAGFNLSSNQMDAVDEIKVRWNYPGGFYAINGKGNNQKTYIRYKLGLYFKRDASASFGSVEEEQSITHHGKHLNAASFEEVFDLERFKPFDDFKVKIERQDSADDPGWSSPGKRKYDDWTNITTGQISTVTSIFKEKMIYPHTSVAKVSYSSKTYQNMPTRSYHCRGMLVKVPSNYVTREESSTGAATYNRNVTSGLINTKYQDWDGNFRSAPVYTNNPAWIFYDIVTNNRYGLGDFVSASDIDKYALYRIARYCDEEIDDGSGTGSTEPRYVMNTYLTKSTDAFKVLKDMLSNFLSMLYYLDGQIYPVQDSPAGPVYAFSKANVIDGTFSYESTGSKTRINQVIVSWNNPENNYKIEPLIVEDRRNIAEKGGIITQKAFAYGCTSEGQATRYGKWKLWTAANQQEIVSFATGVNGAYITPGDIITVQDADRYATRYSGRISSTGTRNTTTIPLDSSVTLNSGSTYTLSVLIQGFAAFLAQDSATIDGTAYVKGDLIKQAFIDSNDDGTYTLQDISTAEYASNAKAADADTDALLLNWTDDFRVETQTVSTSAGSDISSLTVSTAFNSAPAAEDIWVLTETASGSTVDGSGKEYRVLSLSQSSKNQYDITAVEHYDAKYAAIEEDFTTYVAETVYPPVRATDIVPPPKDVWNFATYNGTSNGDDIVLSWSYPDAETRTVTREDGTTEEEAITPEYDNAIYVEISHDFPNHPSPLKVYRLTEHTFRDVPSGSYKIAIRTVNSIGNKSLAVVKDVVITNKYRFRAEFPGGLHRGGSSSTGQKVTQ